MPASRIPALLALVLTLGACADPPLPSPPPQLAGGFQRDMAPEAARACVRSGGTVRRGGMMGAEFCVHSHADAGKACTDGAQCLGRACYWQTPDGPEPPPPPAGAPVIGQCAASTDGFGCWQPVKDGKIGPGLCVD